MAVSLSLPPSARFSAPLSSLRRASALASFARPRLLGVRPNPAAACRTAERAGQPQAVPAGADGEAHHREAEVGDGVQGCALPLRRWVGSATGCERALTLLAGGWRRVPGVGGPIHEPAAGEHGGVGGRHLLRQPRGGAHPVQQCAVHPSRAGGRLRQRPRGCPRGRGGRAGSPALQRRKKSYIPPAPGPGSVRQGGRLDRLPRRDTDARLHVDRYRARGHARIGLVPHRHRLQLLRVRSAIPTPTPSAHTF